MRRTVRRAGTLALLAGLGAVVWSLVVWRWQDPLTYAWTEYRQRALAADYSAGERGFFRRGERVSRRSLESVAARYRASARPGNAVARITIPRLGLERVVVWGTDTESLRSGPGLDPRAAMPGEGALVYVAGHRTTYGAPFSEIDALAPGDRLRLTLPYGTFEYAITGHRIVAATDLRVLRSRGREEIALQACWPRFFASQRYVAYARPTRVFLRNRALSGTSARGAPEGRPELNVP